MAEVSAHRVRQVLGFRLSEEDEWAKGQWQKQRHESLIGYNRKISETVFLQGA